MAITCPNCNATLEDTVKFCSQCGTPVVIAFEEELNEAHKLIREAPRDILPFDDAGTQYLISERTKRWVLHFAKDFNEPAWAGTLYQEGALKAFAELAWSMDKDIVRPNT